MQVIDTRRSEVWRYYYVIDAVIEELQGVMVVRGMVDLVVFVGGSVGMYNSDSMSDR